MRKRSRRGATLIVVLAVLFILTLLATSFAVLQRVERSVSRNYLDGVRARLIARSGIEHAVSELKHLSGTGFDPALLQSLRYYGDDVGETGLNPALLNVPLELAKNPSMAWEDEPTQNPAAAPHTPKAVTIEGQVRGFSNMPSSSSYGRHSDQYSLRVSDASGMIHVNDGLKEDPNFGSVTHNLKRMLNRLGEVNTINIPNLGDQIINSRPATGYQSKRQLIPVLGAANYAKVSHCLTAHAWVDHNVIQPVPISDAPAVLNYYQQRNGFNSSTTNSPWYRGPAPGVFRYGHNRDIRGITIPGRLLFAPEAASPNSLGHAIYGLDSLNPQYIEVCSRAPVNINSAPREVLVALLADLQGVWKAERRRNNPHSDATWVEFHQETTQFGTKPLKFSNSPSPFPGVGLEGDEMGFLYSTDRILRPNETGSGINPYEIADHIIACREARTTPTGAAVGFDYNRVTNPGAYFGGWFRNWRQFYAFVDNLVEIGQLTDSRTDIYYVHPPTNFPNGGISGGSALNNSSGNYGVKMTLAVAAQAIADTLKANFNPNLHLNETNPDENMRTLVDKTDLIVNSTEFTFLPTGYWEIQSVGRVLFPKNTPPDSLTAMDNELRAEAKITAVVRTSDLVRHTSQKDFWAGNSSITPPSPAPAPTFMTNNTLSLEIGPEPDNGPASIENEWGGYIALPTYGHGIAKQKGAVVSTPVGTGADTGSAFCSFHSHFTYDDRAHNHMDGNTYLQNAARITIPGENVSQSPDWSESLPGPYLPTTPGAGPNHHRMARSFRGPVPGVTGTLPTWQQIAPLDLRIDGLYMERDSMTAYWLEALSAGGFYHSSFDRLEAAISFWMKPGFIPELTGKPRLYANFSRVDLRYDEQEFFGYGGNPFTLALFLRASQNPQYENVPVPGSSWLHWFTGHAPLSFNLSHNSSFMSMAAWVPACCTGVDYTRASKTLNHHLHESSLGYPQTALNHPFQASTKESENYYRRDNPLALGRWMHVAIGWRDGIDANNSRIFVNGSAFHETQFVGYDWSEAYWPHLDPSFHTTNDNTATGARQGNACTPPTAGRIAFSDKNIFRFGQPTRISVENPGGGPPATFNLAPDATIDELAYFHGPITANMSAAMLGWTRGRYRPTNSTYDGEFTSDVFAAPSAGTTRWLAPPTNATPTGAAGAGAPPATGPVTNFAKARVIGLSWTWFGETVDVNTVDLEPLMVDWSSWQQQQPNTVRPKAEFWLEVDGAWHGPYTRDYFTSAAPGGIPIQNPANLRWRVRLGWHDPQPSTALKLLATPFIDDVTLYFDRGEVEYFSLFSE